MSKEQEQRLNRIEQVLDTVAMEPRPELNTDSILRKWGIDPEALRIEQQARVASGDNVSLAHLLAEKMGMSGQEFRQALKERVDRINGSGLT